MVFKAGDNRMMLLQLSSMTNLSLSNWDPEEKKMQKD